MFDFIILLAFSVVLGLTIVLVLYFVFQNVAGFKVIACSCVWCRYVRFCMSAGKYMRNYSVLGDPLAATDSVR